MNRKIKSREELKKIVAKLRRQGKKIVSTNGCFDLLHIGHVKYLEEAKKQGDVLIVGLDSDASVKIKKGKERPIIPQNYRAEMLAALECVDYVTIYEEEHCFAFINNAVPDIYVKSEEYRHKKMYGRELLEKLGVKIHYARHLPLFSTTKIIEKIRADK